MWKRKSAFENYELKTAYGDKAMNRVYKGSCVSKTGRTSDNDRERSGRSSIVTEEMPENIEYARSDEGKLTMDEVPHGLKIDFKLGGGGKVIEVIDEKLLR